MRLTRNQSFAAAALATVLVAACATSTSSPTGSAPPPAPAAEVSQPAHELPGPTDDEPLAPLPTVEELLADNDDEHFAARADLGRRLFHDPRLSHDDSLSCASCHDPRYYGIDRATNPTGIRGQTGSVNTPTVFNAMLQVAQFWDGRAATLDDQAEGPPLASGEMGSTREESVTKMQADSRMVTAFTTAFPDEVRGAADITFDHVVTAIVAFETTLVTPGARFDRWLGGDRTALTASELEGYRLFKDVGCATCHYGPAVGGKTFQRLGAKVNYFQGRHIAAADQGRFNVTKDDRDLHMFKVPTLRNVAMTGPYFHDGSMQDLPAAVRAMAHYQLGVDLDDHQVEHIVAFLGSLTADLATATTTR